MKIGFIGLGSMGARIAPRLLEAGHALSVFDIKRGATQQIIEKGATWVDSPKAMADTCELIMSSLPGPPQVEEAVYGSSGLMAGWKPVIFTWT